MGVFGYVGYCPRRLTDIQAKWRAAFAGRRTSSWDSTAPTSWSRPFLVVVGWVSVVGEGCGQAGQQQIEAAVEFGGAVVGGQGGCQRTQNGEFGDRQAVQTEADYVVGFLGSLDDLLQLVEDVAVQEPELPDVR
jgi:hypothetical protein